MPMVSSARRYAEAVFSIALERNELEKWRTDLKKIAEALKNPSVAEAVADPRKPLAEKQKLLKNSLKGLGELPINLASLLVARGRTRIADQLVVQYERLADAHLGIEHVQVTTAVNLANGEKQTLLDRLSKITGKNIALETKVDPAILGGLKIKIGDRLIDGTTASNLQSLKKSLVETGAKGL